MRPAISDIGSNNGNRRFTSIVSYASAVTPDFINASVSARFGAKCRYVKRICPRRSNEYSAGNGSFTLTTSSACLNAAA
jgi:hypothetical protein